MPAESCPEPNERSKNIFSRLGKKLLNAVDNFGASIARASHSESDDSWPPPAKSPKPSPAETVPNELITEDHLDWIEFCMLRDPRVVTAAQVLRRIGPGIPETRP